MEADSQEPWTVEFSCDTFACNVEVCFHASQLSGEDSVRLLRQVLEHACISSVNCFTEESGGDITLFS